MKKTCSTKTLVVSIVVLVLLIAVGLAIGLSLYFTHKKNHPPEAIGVVFWHSQPVVANETVLVTGGPWTADANLTVQLVSLPNSNPTFPVQDFSDSSISSPVFDCTVLSQTNYSISFVIPPEAGTNVYAYKIILDESVLISSWTLLNVPNLWYIQGDMGKLASPGGWIGAYGTSMLLIGSGSSYSPQMVLVDIVSGQSFVLSQSKVKGGNRWVQYFDVPASMPNSTYQVNIHHGSGGPYSWIALSNSIGSEIITTIKIQANREIVWPNFQIDFTKMPGATYDKQMAAAIQNLSKSDGGILVIPPGNHTLYNTITLPPRTIMQGAGRGVSILTWKLTSSSVTAITGTTFGIQDLTVWVLINSTSNYCGFNAISKANSNSEFSWIRRVDLYGPNKMLNTQRVCISNSYITAIGIVSSENTAIEDVYFDDCSNCISIAGYSNYTRIANVTMNFRAQNILFRCGHNLVTENIYRYLLGNIEINSWGVGNQPGYLIGEYCGQSMTRDIYYGNNTSEGEYGVWNDNTVADGKEGWYYGGVLSVKSTSMTMNDTIRVPVFEGASYRAPNTTDFSMVVGSIVMIVGGRGMGQYRFLASAGYHPTNAPVTIDQPWDLEPDQTSTIAITKFKGRVILASNAFSSEGIHMQAWFASSEVIYADNQMGANFSDWRGIFDLSLPGHVGAQTGLSYTGGFRYGNGSFPGFHSGNWYHQALNNSVKSFSSGLDISYSVSGYPSVSSVPWSGQISFGNIIRNNLNNHGCLFTVHLAAYTGAIVVERNAALSLLAYESMVTFAVIRGNYGPNGTNVILSCNERTCGVYDSPKLRGCQLICSNNSVILP